MTEEKLEGPIPADSGAKRRKWLSIVFLVFLVGAIGYGLYYTFVLSHHESTDDAYVNGNIVQITSQVTGTVVKIGADDTDFVPAGKVLVQLDTADAKVALAQAESQLAKTVRQVRNLYATSSQLQAAVAVHDAELSKAKDDLARRERLMSSGAVSGEELQHARDALRSAEAASNAARQQLAAQQALVDRTTVEEHPDVRPPPRRCAKPISPTRAPRSRRPSPGMSPSAACSSASASPPARRSWPSWPWTTCGSMPTSRNRSCATCASANRSR